MAAKSSKKAAPKPAAKAAAKPAKAPAKAAKSAKPAKKAAPKKAAAAPAIVHWEIQAKNAPKLHKFYSQLFGWKIDANNEYKYGVVPPAGKGSIGGGIGPAGHKPFVTVYAQVDDIKSYLAKVEKLGGKTIMPRTEMSMVTLAMFTDPEGNAFGLVEG